MWPSPFLSILKGTQTGLGEREVGGQLLHGDIPFSVLSERKTDRARKKKRGGCQLRHGALYSTLFLLKEKLTGQE